MAKALSDATTETRIYLDEASQQDYLTTEVTLAINRSYHRVIQKVIEVYDDWYNDVTQNPYTIAMVNGQQEYQISSSIIKVTRVEIDYGATGIETNAARAVPVKKDEIRMALGNNNSSGSYFSTGYYVHGNIGNQTIGFVPVPIASDTGNNKSIWVWGVTLPVDLVNTTDNINIPYADNFVQLIAKGAAAFLLRKGQQEMAAAAELKAEFEEELIDYQTFLKDRQSDDGQYIEDTALENIDYSTLEIV